jgi:hypothetical protein
MQITRELQIAFRFNTRHNRRPSDSPQRRQRTRGSIKFQLETVKRAPVFKLSHSVALGLRFDGRVISIRPRPLDRPWLDPPSERK